MLHEHQLSYMFTTTDKNYFHLPNYKGEKFKVILGDIILIVSLVLYNQFMPFSTWENHYPPTDFLPG